jgi:hypothetical protein
MAVQQRSVVWTMPEARATPNINEQRHGDSSDRIQYVTKGRGREVRVQHPAILSLSHSLIKTDFISNSASLCYSIMSVWRRSINIDVICSFGRLFETYTKNIHHQLSRTILNKKCIQSHSHKSHLWRPSSHQFIWLQPNFHKSIFMLSCHFLIHQTGWRSRNGLEFYWEVCGWNPIRVADNPNREIDDLS